MNSVYFLVFYLILLIILVFGYQSQDIKYINCILLFFIFLVSLSIILIIVYLIRGMTMCQLAQQLICNRNNINRKVIKII